MFTFSLMQKSVAAEVCSDRPFHGDNSIGPVHLLTPHAMVDPIFCENDLIEFIASPADAINVLDVDRQTKSRIADAAGYLTSKAGG